jgi:molybdopterin biosynthesis enzyme
MVTFEEFVRPALCKLSGDPAWLRPRVEAVLA